MLCGHRRAFGLIDCETELCKCFNPHSPAPWEKSCGVLMLSAWQGWTPLHLSAFRRNRSAVDKLLKAGAMAILKTKVNIGVECCAHRAIKIKISSTLFPWQPLELWLFLQLCVQQKNQAPENTRISLTTLDSISSWGCLIYVYNKEPVFVKT